MEYLSVVSSSILTVLLIFVGVYFTVKMNFFQIVKFPHIVKTVVLSANNKDKESIKSMLLALGGTVGVGNIAGVGAAIALGGAGSIFWIWICGLIGMITKYAEVYLAVEFGPSGPYGYINKTFNKLGKAVTIIFGISCILSSVLIGNVIQSKAVIDTLTTSFNFDYTVCALIIGVPVFLIVFSNTDFIKNTSSYAVPFVSVLYILMSALIILKNRNMLIPSVSLIFKDAFTLKSTSSGVLGFLLSAAVRQGISKGLFSHEAGQGSAPIAYSSEQNANSKSSAYLGVLEVFVDTGIISTLTALAMLTSGFWNENGMISAVNMFVSSFGNVGGVLFAVSIYLFCIAAISGWIFYAKRSIEILFNHNMISIIYSLVSVMIIPFVAYIPIGFLWQLSDLFMLLMALPNIISLIYFRKLVFSSIRK